MDQETHIDKLQEQTANRTKKSEKAGPKPWELDKYIYKEEPRDDDRSSHSDPRLELGLQSHGQYPDSDSISSDDYGYGSPVFGIGAMPDLSASASSASDQGTLAGGGCFSKPRTEVQQQPRETRQTQRRQQPQSWSFFDQFSETDNTGRRRHKSHDYGS